MRRFASAFVAAIALCSGIAAAGTVAVRSGEHGDFTRLVFDFADTPQWRLEPGASRYDLVVPPGRHDFDLGSVFDKIGRARVAGLEPRPDGDGLTIELGCDCVAEAFLLRGRSVVVDLRARDAAAGPTASPVADDAAAIPSLTRAPVDRGHLPAAFGLIAPAGPMPQVAAPTRPFAPVPRPPALGAVTADPAPRRPDAAVRPRRLVGDSADDNLARLAAALARAASEGIAQPAETLPTLTPVPAARGLAPGIGLRSVYDAGPGLPVRPTVVTSCIADGRLDLTGWYAETKDLGRLRAVLVDPVGRLNPDAVEAVSRYYLSRGFGAEAAQVEALLPADRRDPVRTALADILDRGFSESDALAGQSACPTAAALWSAFVGPTGPPGLAAGDDRLVETFSGLPAPLRLHLGANLAVRLRHAGRHDDASVVLNAVARIGDIGEPNFGLAVSRLALGGPEAEIARNQLLAIARSTDPTAAAALETLFRDSAARGVPPQEAWIDMAPPLVLAGRGTAAADALRRSRLEGLIALGRLREARGELHAAAKRMAPGDAARLRTRLLAAAARDGSDAEVVELALVAARVWAGEPGGTAVQVLEARLAEIGLTQMPSGPALAPQPTSAARHAPQPAPRFAPAPETADLAELIDDSARRRAAMVAHLERLGPD